MEISSANGKIYYDSNASLIQVSFLGESIKFYTVSQLKNGLNTLKATAKTSVEAQDMGISSNFSKLQKVEFPLNEKYILLKHDEIVELSNLISKYLESFYQIPKVVAQPKTNCSINDIVFSNN